MVLSVVDCYYCGYAFLLYVIVDVWWLMPKLLIILVFFQVMTWVWLLRFLNMWRISPSLPPVSSRYHINIKAESKWTVATFTKKMSFRNLSDRMQNWSSTLEVKTLKMLLRVGLLPWTRHQRVTWSSLHIQVCGFSKKIYSKWDRCIQMWLWL